MTVNPLLGAYLEAAGMTKDGQPNRAWFEESVARSQKAIAFAEEEKERELAAILSEAQDGA